MKSKRRRLYISFLELYAIKRKLFPLYMLTIIIIILSAGISLIRPELQGQVVDGLGNPQNSNMSTFMVLLGAFLSILLLNYLMNYVQRYIISVISEEIAADIRQSVEDKLSTVKVTFFEKIKLSDILLKVDKDVIAIKQCGITSLITLISNIVILIVVPPYMFSIHKSIAASNILLLISVPFISKFLGKLIQTTSEDVLEGYNDITDVLTDTYNNWFSIKIFQCGLYIHNKYFQSNQKYKKATNNQNLLYILNTVTILTIQFIGMVIIWVVGAREVFDGNMTVGTIMALMNYQTIIMNPIIGIAQFANEYHTAIVSLEDINQLLQYPDEKADKKDELKNIEKITLKNVTFSYSESQSRIFENININFHKGYIYGIHGKSGHGKSTLFKIIAGIYQPLEGKVEVNNIDFKKFNINMYWRNIGYVMQRTRFFNDSIRKNMELLREVTVNELDSLAECLDLYNEIHALEMNWETVIKNEACNFSEGQMRRLDIMRNILKDPQVLIFDEVTANIDAQRRKHFYELLHELSKNKIIIFTTHNSDELNEADILIDLEKYKGSGGVT